jgi:hypothetical protein
MNRQFNKQWLNIKIIERQNKEVITKAKDLKLETPHSESTRQAM